MEFKKNVDTASIAMNVKYGIDELLEQMGKAEPMDFDTLTDVIVNAIALLMYEVSLRRSNGV